MTLGHLVHIVLISSQHHVTDEDDIIGKSEGSVDVKHFDINVIELESC